VTTALQSIQRSTTHCHLARGHIKLNVYRRCPEVDSLKVHLHCCHGLRQTRLRGVGSQIGRVRFGSFYKGVGACSIFKSPVGAYLTMLGASCSLANRLKFNLGVVSSTVQPAEFGWDTLLLPICPSGLQLRAMCPPNIWALLVRCALLVHCALLRLICRLSSASLFGCAPFTSGGVLSPLRAGW
jgi:hypothetical protein